MRQRMTPNKVLEARTKSIWPSPQKIMVGHITLRNSMRMALWLQSKMDNAKETWRMIGFNREVELPIEYSYDI